MSPPQGKPRVLLVSLNSPPYFDDMYEGFIDALAEKAHVQRTKNPNTVRHILAERPKAVLLTDGALTKPENVSVWISVLDYVHGGGRAICMGMFSSLVSPPDLDPFFARSGLPWEMGAYVRTTVSLCRANIPPTALSLLPPAYSLKAIFLRGVGTDAAWYRSTAESRSESLASAGEQIALESTPVALAKVGAGKLGYVGDVNNEGESQVIILAMCGLYL